MGTGLMFHFLRQGDRPPCLILVKQIIRVSGSVPLTLYDYALSEQKNRERVELTHSLTQINFY